MEQIINQLKNVFYTYGFQAFSIIVLSIIIVNIIKKPIMKKANEFAERTGLDKSIITKNISVLPLVVNFVLTAIFAIVVNKFNFSAIKWGEIMATASIYSAVAIATYEVIKKILEGYVVKKQLDTKVKKELPPIAPPELEPTVNAEDVVDAQINSELTEVDGNQLPKLSEQQKGDII